MKVYKYSDPVEDVIDAVRSRFGVTASAAFASASLRGHERVSAFMDLESIFNDVKNINKYFYEETNNYGERYIFAT